MNIKSRKSNVKIAATDLLVENLENYSLNLNSIMNKLKCFVIYFFF